MKAIHIHLRLLGTELFTITLYVGPAEELEEGAYEDGPFEGMTDDDVDAMLDAMLEAREERDDDE